MSEWKDKDDLWACVLCVCVCDAGVYHGRLWRLIWIAWELWVIAWWWWWRQRVNIVRALCVCVCMLQMCSNCCGARLAWTRAATSRSSSRRTPIRPAISFNATSPNKHCGVSARIPMWAHHQCIVSSLHYCCDCCRAVNEHALASPNNRCSRTRLGLSICRALCLLCRRTRRPRTAFRKCCCGRRRQVVSTCAKRRFPNNSMYVRHCVRNPAHAWGDCIQCVMTESLVLLGQFANHYCGRDWCDDHDAVPRPAVLGPVRVRCRRSRLHVGSRACAPCLCARLRLLQPERSRRFVHIATLFLVTPAALSIRCYRHFLCESKRR